MQITISNDPITGLNRKFRNIKFLRDEAEERIVISGTVELLYDGEIVNRKSYEFNATKNHWVNESGDVVPGGHESAIMTEYDYYNQLAIAIIDPEVEKVVLKLDQNQRFD